MSRRNFVFEDLRHVTAKAKCMY